MATPIWLNVANADEIAMYERSLGVSEPEAVVPSGLYLISDASANMTGTVMERRLVPTIELVRIHPAAVTFSTLFFMGLPTGAQVFPSGQVTIVPPYQAGGTSDIIARELAQRLSVARMRSWSRIAQAPTAQSA